MTTPFNADRSLDLKGLRELTAFYAEQGIPNVIAAGSTGEFYSLTDEERKQVIRTVVEEAAGRMLVIGCCAHSGTSIAKELAIYCAGIGCDGIMVTPPYYVYSGSEGLKCHYQAISDAAEIGIVVYFSGSVLRFPHIQGLVQERWECPQELRELAEIPNVGALKDASGSFGFHRDIILGLDGPDGLLAVMGSDGMGYHMWGHLWGSRCFLTGLGNIWPKPEIAFFGLLEKGDLEGARQIVAQREIGYLRATKATGKYFSCVKYLLNKMGLPGGYVRPPLLDLNEHERQSMNEMCSACGLDEQLF
jgi:4-hydroxy-tetrahydrodipicolinate synthase